MSPAQVLERPPVELRLGELPVLPAVVVRLMSLSPQSEDLFEEVLAVAQEDPGFALRVMHIANSAMSSPASRIETLERAVARLGAAHVADLVTTVAMTRVFVPRTPAEKDLWRHAIEVATACRTIIRRHPVNGVSAEQGYLAGLLHDIGHFIMIDQAPSFIQAVDALGSTTPAELDRGREGGMRDRPCRARSSGLCLLVGAGTDRLRGQEPPSFDRRRPEPAARGVEAGRLAERLAPLARRRQQPDRGVATGHPRR